MCFVELLHVHRTKSEIIVQSLLICKIIIANVP